MPRNLITSIARQLAERPSVGDVASVLRATPAGAGISIVNAMLFAIGTWSSLGGPVLGSWLAGTILACLYIFLKSHRIRDVTVSKVSRRAARRLRFTATILALPWAVLALWVLPIGSEFDRVLVLLVCAGMFTGASMMLQRTLAAALTFTGVVVGGVIMGCILAGRVEFVVVILYALLCSGFVITSASFAGDTARERDRMVERLVETNAELKAAYAKISSLALVDSVTGLPNRKAFRDAVETTFSTERAGGACRAVMLFDLDNFKNINDSFGHAAGDELLKITGERIRNALKGEGVVARLGGDEFAVMAPIGGRHPNPVGLADALIAAVSQPVAISGRQVFPSSSMGFALFPEDGDDVGDLLRDADAALARAKEKGKCGWAQFDEEIGRELADMGQIAADLTAALDEESLSVHYQPKIDIRTGKMVGSEALLRWTHPTLGAVPPDRFLSTAAEWAMIHRLTAFVFARVAQDILTWRSQGVDPGRVAINIHPVDLKESDHLMRLIRDLMDKGIGPEAVSIEITEGCFVGRGTEAAPMILDAIADLGFRLSLDDFGTGHAALTHLRNLPVAEIKIDKSFVANLATAQSDRAIVDATVAIARGMGLESVAEGVETAEQIAVLRDLGADYGQGFYWAEPLRANELADFAKRVGVSRANSASDARSGADCDRGKRLA